MSKIFLRHTLIKKYPWHFSWLLLLYTFSLYENASLITVSTETEYISTRSWYRNINFLRDRIRRIWFQSLSWYFYSVVESTIIFSINSYFPFVKIFITLTNNESFTITVRMYQCLTLNNVIVKGKTRYNRCFRTT